MCPSHMVYYSMIKIKNAVWTPCNRFGEVMEIKKRKYQDWALVRFIGTDKTEWYVVSALKRSTIPCPIEEMRKLYGTGK